MQDKIFISYSSADADFAIALDHHLDEAGFDSFLDKNDILPGERWDDTIQKALKDSTTVVVVLSPTSVSSDNVLDEIDLALRAHKRVIPVRYKVCEVPMRISRLQYVDFVDNYDAGLTRLTATLKGIPAPPPPPPPPPEPTRSTLTTTPIPTNTRPTAGRSRALIIGAIVVALLAAGLWFRISSKSNGTTSTTGTEGATATTVTRSSTSSTPKPSPTVDWYHIRFDDPRLQNCNGSEPCLARKKVSDQIRSTTWSAVLYSNPLLQDCMGYPACVERQSHQALLQHANWPSVKPNDPLLKDCMGYEPCLSTRMRVTEVKPPPCVPENLPDCCRDSPDPAACRKCKKTADIRDHCE